MSKMLASILLIVLLAASASAHRVDEYLQATIFSIEKDHVQATMRLAPGIAVSSIVIASIDSNGDGVISEAEKKAYVERLLGDLSLTVDGNRLMPRLVSMAFPEVEEMKEGLGEIHIEFTAALPVGGHNPGDHKRRLVFENHHQKDIAAYLVNCLVPGNPEIRIVSQNRNEEQSVYRLDYVQAGER
jgi:hypothetical protein